MENKVEVIKIVQAKYAPAPVPQTAVIVQAKYAPAPVPQTIEIVQAKYAPAPVPQTAVIVHEAPAPTIESVQVKYAPAPVPQTVEIVHEAPAPTIESVQAKYAPAPPPVVVPVTPTVPSPEPPTPPAPIGCSDDDIYGSNDKPSPPTPEPPVPPTPIGCSEDDIYGSNDKPSPPTPEPPAPPTPIGCSDDDIYGSNDKPSSPESQNFEDDNSIVTSSFENFEDVINAHSFLENVKRVIDELDKLYSNSFYVRSSFGSALSATAENFKNDIISLKKYGEENLLKSMNYVSEYNENNIEVKKNQELLSQINIEEDVKLFHKINNDIGSLEVENKKIRTNIENFENQEI